MAALEAAFEWRELTTDAPRRTIERTSRGSSCLRRPKAGDRGRCPSGILTSASTARNGASCRSREQLTAIRLTPTTVASAMRIFGRRAAMPTEVSRQVIVRVEQKLEACHSEHIDLAQPAPPCALFSGDRTTDRTSNYTRMNRRISSAHVPDSAGPCRPTPAPAGGRLSSAETPTVMRPGQKGAMRLATSTLAAPCSRCSRQVLRRSARRRTKGGSNSSWPAWTDCAQAIWQKRTRRKSRLTGGRSESMRSAYTPRT